MCLFCFPRHQRHDTHPVLHNGTHISIIDFGASTPVRTGLGLFTAAMVLLLGRNNITTPYPLNLTWITRGAESGEQI